MDKVVETHGQVMRALGRIEGKVDGLYPTVARQRQDHEGLEARTRVLENWKWYLVGLFSLSSIATVVSIVAIIAVRG
jgi:hypothetical protein